ncbi:MAG: hypothetical protein KGO51_16590 [Alphaproteobacteria bacterium]|nr:hypothetical protein [Alphaproteobacteria bacterium]
MRDSERYMAQAEAVLRMANRAGTPAERQVYESIAEGWRKLAAEARRNEKHEERGAPVAPEPRPFRDR